MFPFFKMVFVEEVVVICALVLLVMTITIAQLIVVTLQMDNVFTLPGIVMMGFLAQLILAIVQQEIALTLQIMHFARILSLVPTMFASQEQDQIQMVASLLPTTQAVPTHSLVQTTFVSQELVQTQMDVFSLPITLHVLQESLVSPAHVNPLELTPTLQDVYFRQMMQFVLILTPAQQTLVLLLMQLRIPLQDASTSVITVNVLTLLSALWMFVPEQVEMLQAPGSTLLQVVKIPQTTHFVTTIDLALEILAINSH